MNGATHMAFAGACWLGGCLLLQPGPVAAGAGALLAAITAPQCDLDNLGAWAKLDKPRRKREPIRWALSKLGIHTHRHPIRWRIALVLSEFGPHRQGPAHSLITAAVLGWVLTAPMIGATWWPWWIGPAVFVGLASHIVLDLANDKPVRILYPLPLMVEGLGVRVGKAWEILAIRPACYAAALGLAWLTFRH